MPKTPKIQSKDRRDKSRMLEETRSVQRAGKLIEKLQTEGYQREVRRSQNKWSKAAKIVLGERKENEQEETRKTKPRLKSVKPRAPRESSKIEYQPRERNSR